MSEVPDETGRIFGPLKTREEYEMALDEISELIDMDPVPESFFGRELYRLVALAQEFEALPTAAS